MSELQVRFFENYFRFEALPGRPFDLDRMVAKEKRDQADRVFSSQHEIDPVISKKIHNQISFNETKWGTLKQFILSLGCIIPTGIYLGGVFDLDRDLIHLHDMLARVLGSVFDSNEYSIIDYVGDGRFRDGWLLFRVTFDV